MSVTNLARKMVVTFVTGNKNKLAEVQAILADSVPNLRSQDLDSKYLIETKKNRKCTVSFDCQ